MILTFLIMLFTFYLVLFDLFDIIQLVISMTDFNNIVITGITKPVTVRLEKGRQYFYGQGNLFPLGCQLLKR